jgi:phosphatidylserine decarboxylase
MKITPYGKDVVLRMFAITVLLDVIAFFVPNLIAKITLVVLSILLFGFTLYFFRDPLRKLTGNEKEEDLISPADGKVVLIEEIDFKGDYFTPGEKLTQISIFLSPLNVHVNYIPLTGMVDYLKYIPGDYLVAFDHKSSERNERTEIGITSKSGKRVLFKQIAGFVARRIVYTIKEGDEVFAGEKFGMIKFGSRTDILFKNAASINVKVGDKVVAGETIIAEL